MTENYPVKLEAAIKRALEAHPAVPEGAEAHISSPMFGDTTIVVNEGDNKG